ncbi:MAG: CPBP family intramembrane glutamic endopeptidase [Terracidiphilus sp.]
MSAQSAPSNPAQSEFLKPFWVRAVCPPWLLALLLMSLLGGVRYFAVFSTYQAQPLFFLQYAATWILPFIFLTRNGRGQIGLHEQGTTPLSMGLGALAGAVYALAVFAIGMTLYGDSRDNWDLSLRDYLRLIELRGVLPPGAVFAIFGVPAILFAPIGDEILFRGFIQETITRRWGPIAATLVNCLTFGLTYLYFHAIWQDSAGIHLRLVSGALAMILFIGAGLVFTLCRLVSGSLWSAVAAHAAFNLTMLGVAILYYMR